jgi:hypothetical protein
LIFEMGVVVGISCSMYSSVPPSILSRWSRSPGGQLTVTYIINIKIAR